MVNGVQRRAVQQDLAPVDIVEPLYEVHYCTLRQAQLGWVIREEGHKCFSGT